MGFEALHGDRYQVAVTPLCRENLSSHLFYCQGVDFRIQGFFLVLKRTVLIINYYLWDVGNQPGLLLECNREKKNIPKTTTR